MTSAPDRGKNAWKAFFIALLYVPIATDVFYTLVVMAACQFTSFAQQQVICRGGWAEISMGQGVLIFAFPFLLAFPIGAACFQYTHISAGRIR